jgi:hypothetical protein
LLPWPGYLTDCAKFRQIPATLTIASLTKKPSSPVRTNGSANKLPSQWQGKARQASHLFLTLSRRTATRVVRTRHTSCTLALEAAPLGTKAIRRIESNVRHFVSSDTRHACWKVMPWNATNKPAFRRDMPLPCSGCSSDRKIQGLFENITAHSHRPAKPST